MLTIPQLCRKKDVFPIDAAFLDAGTDFVLIAVDGRTVDVLVPIAERNLDGVLNLVWRCLPCAEAYSRDDGAGVEFELCRKTHIDCDSRWFKGLFVVLIYSGDEKCI